MGSSSAASGSSSSRCWPARSPSSPRPGSSCWRPAITCATTTVPARPAFPRTAVLIPAWNEGAVIGESIDRLMKAEYPPESLRIFVVDDASTRRHPAGGEGQGGAVPGQVVHLRREKGGQGKAHTLNHGLAVILDDDWMEALLITDADVIFEPAALRTMTRHLADPRVGAVTSYIKEGSRPGNYLTRFIGYEYVTAQAAARRGQNVLGATRVPGRRRAAALAGQPARPRRPDRHHLAGGRHDHHLRDPAARPPGGLRAARHLLGGRARDHRGPVEAAAPLGARQRAGHLQVPQALVPAVTRAPPRRHHLRRELVLPASSSRSS